MLRFIHAALNSQREPSQTNSETTHSSGITHPRPNEGAKRVVLVSWLRNTTWWNDSGRKLGLDISRIKIIDALSMSLGLSTTDLVAIDSVEKTILGALSSSSDSLSLRANDATSDSVILVLDGIDLLLAANAFSALSINDMILGIREHVHATVLTASADGPLMHGSTTPLDSKHAAFLMGMVHQADLVMSVRELGTGVAKDVSGVMRVTKGTGVWVEEMKSNERQEREFLFFVGGDGRAKIFERGM